MIPVRPALRGLLIAIGLTATLAACEEEEGAEAPELRPVRTVVVEETTAGETMTLSGTVESQVEVDLAFRIGGRLTERLVDVGDTVEAGQVVARLDPTDEENALRAAEAGLAAADGQLSEARIELRPPAPALRAPDRRARGLRARRTGLHHGAGGRRRRRGAGRHRPPPARRHRARRRCGRAWSPPSAPSRARWSSAGRHDRAEERRTTASTPCSTSPQACSRRSPPDPEVTVALTWRRP